MHLRAACLGVRYVGLCPSALFVLLLAGCSQPGLVLTTDLCDGLDNDTDGRVDEGRGEAIGCAAGEVCVDAMCGCDPGGCRLSVAESCSATIDYLVRCGNYTPPVFHASTPEESVAECVRSFSELSVGCQELLSDINYCWRAAACGPDTCASELTAFRRDCPVDG